MFNNEEMKEIIKQAEKEIKEEKFWAAVQKKKEELLTKKSLIDRIFPYKILIIRK